VVCSSSLDDPLIVLPEFPLTELYVPFKNTQKTAVLDQEFYLCRKCGLGQLKNLVSGELLYSDGYVTRTSTSSSATAAIHQFTEFIDEILPDGKLDAIFDIGCNDNYLIKQFAQRSHNLFGNDPIIDSRVEDYKESQLTLIGDFFENIDFDTLGVNIDCFLCSHTLEHIVDPASFLSKALDAGNENTLYFFQFPGLEGMIRDAHFDQIFHQHFNYFSLKSIQYLLSKLGGELIDYRVNAYHWNSLMIAFRKTQTPAVNQIFFSDTCKTILNKPFILRQYELFKQSMKITSNRLKSLNNERILGYGAALMLPVLDYHLEDGLSNVEAIIDEDLSKVGKYYLNVPIQIISTKMAGRLEDSIVLLTAINSTDASRKIIPKLIDLKFRQIIIPLNLI